MTDNVIDAEVFFIARTKFNRIVKKLNESGQEEKYDIFVTGPDTGKRFYEIDSLDDVEIWLHDIEKPVRTLIDLNDLD